MRRLSVTLLGRLLPALVAILLTAAPPASAIEQLSGLFREAGGRLSGATALGTVSFEPGVVRLSNSGLEVTVRLGGNQAVVPRGERPEGALNYLLGSDPSRWQRNVQAFREVVYRDLYPGIDLAYVGRNEGAKSEYRVVPGADAAAIRWNYEGVDGVFIQPDGSLLLVSGASRIVEKAPVAWQASGSVTTPVQAAFRRNRDGSFSFDLGSYRPDLPLVIDPPISFSTYFGGTRGDVATGVAVDAAGNAYVCGWTESSDFPTLAPQQAVSGGGADAFVAKFSSTGTLVYATYLGGIAEDHALAIAVDSSGNAIVAGYTASANFPTVASAQGTNRGSKDAFVAKLNASGTSLLFSTFAGGSGSDAAYAVAVDAQGAVYVGGDTTSTNFPVSASPYQSVNRGGTDAFVAKYSSAGALVYSSYLGGSGSDHAYGIAVDASGNAYLTGGTDSSNFPTASPLQSTIGGAQDAFVTKLNPAGSALVYSTYLGGNGGIVGYPETGNAIAVDSTGSAYVTGSTSSTNFPTSSAFQPTLTVGGLDAFVTKLSPAGSALVYSTYLGGTGQQIGRGIAVTPTGLAYVAGSTTAPDFPTFTPVQGAIAGPMNGFLAGVNASGSALVLGSYLGGNSLDSANAVALDSAQNLYVAGQTQSSNFPAVNAIQSFGGLVDMFLTRLGAGVQPPSGGGVSPSSGTGPSQTFTLTYTDPQGYQDLASTEVLLNTSPTAPGGCSVRFDRLSKSLYLRLESGSTARGWAKAGAAVLLQNSMCVVDVANSSVSLSGNTVIVNLALRFKPVFRGSLNVYLQSRSRSGLASTWQSQGTWIVP